MQKVRDYYKERQRDLNRNIFVGERYERNMRGIAICATLIIAVNAITGFLNLKNGYYSAVIAALIFILAGLIILFFIRIRKDRKGAVMTAIVSVVIIFTYEIFTVSHGFPVFWTMLIPLAVCYFAGVKLGIYLSLYFLALYWLLFYTPLFETVAEHYSATISQRFPILYLANVVLTGYIMVQYHRNTLHQMDYAEQLLAAKEEAERANRAKSDFLADMSHEIRTPINAVLGMNEMVLRESLRAREMVPPEQEELRDSFQNITTYVGNIESAGSNLLSIINDILDFSKIEAGRLELVHADYMLSSVLNDVCNMIFFKAQDKGLSFSVDVDETIPDNLYGDEVRVRQVITNILNNAVKYTNEGEVRLSVRGKTEAVGESGQELQLTFAVSDTGIGIKPEDIGKLFDKFQRIDLKQNSTVEGTGLGLAITRNLLDMMGGSIQVESEYGKGSVFTVTIPQKVISSEQIGRFQTRFEESMREAKAYESAFRAPDAQILIVDDTRMNLTVVVGLLKNTKIKIDTASGGAGAIKLADGTAYDLILMDQRMPVMDGTDALHRIRELESGLNRETPVICLTADAVIGAKERYLAEGFTDYLTKPIDSIALERMLMKYLPADKVQAVQTEEAPAAGEPPAGSDDALFAPLRAAGIDPETGLGYCQNDGAFYRSVLAEYAQEAEEKIQDLQRYFEAEDWKNYAILVHALKSTSKMIGAAELSGQAAGLEAAANEADAETIRAGHDGTVAKYRCVLEAARSCISDAEVPDEDGDILEFMPEEGGADA